MPATNPYCYPVWNHAHLRDPYMASIKAIRKARAREPEMEAVLIGSVFDVAHARMFKGIHVSVARLGEFESGDMQR